MQTVSDKVYEQYKAKKDALEDKYDDDDAGWKAAIAKFDEAWDLKYESYIDMVSLFPLAVRTKFN